MCYSCIRGAYDPSAARTDYHSAEINTFAEQKKHFLALRLLRNTRILDTFEGAAEIQAQVMARRLLDGS